MYKVLASHKLYKHKCVPNGVGGHRKMTVFNLPRYGEELPLYSEYCAQLPLYYELCAQLVQRRCQH